MIDADVRKLSDSVNNLQKDMAQVGTLVERLDVTIDKLTEVSTTVSQLLAVQASRLEYHEKTTNLLADAFEKRRTELDSVIHNIYSQMIVLERDLKKFSADADKILDDKIAGLTKELKDDIHKSDKRISLLEKWFWVFLGAGTFITFILSNISNIKTLGALH